MKFIQVDKTEEYIFSHINDDLHLITCVRVPEKKSYDGRILSPYTQFKTKSLTKMTLEEIINAVNDKNTVLIRIDSE